MEIEQHDLKTTISILFIGDSETGKTSVVSRICEDEFETNYVPTLCLESKQRNDNMRNLILLFWDVEGGDTYQNFTATYLREAQSIVVIYDISKRESFENMKNKWYNKIEKFARSSVISFGMLILGNKKDLDDQRQVSIEEGEEYAKSINAMHMEFSAKDGSSQEIISKIGEFVDKIRLNEGE